MTNAVVLQNSQSMQSIIAVIITSELSRENERVSPGEIVSKIVNFTFTDLIYLND